MAHRPNKAERQRRNQARRDALAARSANAGEATEIASGDREPVASEATRAESAEPARKGARPARGGQRKPGVPGQRAVFFALVFAVVSSVTLIITPFVREVEVPADDPRAIAAAVDEDVDLEPDDEGNVVIEEEIKLLEEESAPVAAVVLAAPIAICGAAVWFSRKPQRSVAWTIAMLTMALYVFAAAPYSTYGIVPLIALAVAGFFAQREKSKERIAQIRAEKAAKQKSRGEVIDAEAVEEPASEDDSVR